MSFGRAAGLSHKTTDRGPGRRSTQPRAPGATSHVRARVMEEPHPPPDLAPPSTTGLLVIGGPVAAADVPRLCERLTAVIATSDADVVVCDVGDLAADTQTIAALARLQLTARRLQRRIRLQRASRDLQQVLAFVGLADVFPVGRRATRRPAPRPELLGRPRRNAEQREHPLGVEKRVDRDDPPV